MDTYSTGTPPPRSTTTASRSTTSSNNRALPRIVGGNNSLPGEFPWAATIEEYYDKPGFWGPICGAVFILSDWLLTAAHCMFTNEILLSPDKIRIRYNAEAQRYQNLDQVMAAKIIVHPLYNRVQPINRGVDIALIRLAQNVSFERIDQRNYFRANAICLSDTSWSLIGNEDVLWMSSFGPMDYSGIRPEVLQKFMVVPQELSTPWYNTTLLKSTFRIGYAACMGDSGSPVAFHNADGRFFLAGIHSSGNLWNDTARCAYEYGSHVQVIHDNLDWVKETISQEMGWPVSLN